jgi:hypothetical protein
MIVVVDATPSSIGDETTQEDIKEKEMPARMFFEVLFI